MTPERFRIGQIEVASRLRTPGPEAVDVLARSMAEIGLQTPITVRIVDTMMIDGEEVGNVPVVVAGATRFAAAKKLGWTHIDCFVVDMDETEAGLWEIDENLCRKELSAEEKREHLLHRKALWEKRQAEIQVAHHAPPEIGYQKPPPQTKGFAADTAEKAGMSKSQINRLLKPAPVKIAPNPINELEAKEKQVAALMSAWNKAGKDAREEFLLRIDATVLLP